MRIEPASGGWTPGHETLDRAKNWLRPQNHNFLRLTRILKSLTLLGHGDRAWELLECLVGIDEKVRGVIGETTLAYWREAALHPERSEG